MITSLAYFVSLLRRDFAAYCNQRLQEIGLSQGLLFFIIYVGRHPGCSPKELAESLHMDTGHATRSLAKLERDGFLRQETNSADRRAHILKLEARGEDAFRFSQELFTRWDSEVMAAMPEAEREQLLLLLQKLVRAEAAERCVRDAVQSH